MGNFSPFSFARLGRDAVDQLYPAAKYVADFERGIYRTESNRRAALSDAVTCDRSTISQANRHNRFYVTDANMPVIESGPDGAALRVEQQATNRVRNSACAGAITGQLNAGGSMPSQWGGNVSGIPASGVEVIHVGSSEGIDYVRVRYHGTTTSPSVLTYFEASQSIPALSGQRWLQSAFIRIAGGTASNITTTRAILINQTSTGYHGAISGSPVTLSDQWQRVFVDGVLDDAAASGSIAYVQPAMQMVTLGAASEIDITIDLGFPQAERDQLTSPIRSTGAATTRAADIITSASPISAGPFYVATSFIVAAPQPNDSFDRIFEFFGPDFRGFLQIQGTSGLLRMLTQNAAGDLAGVSLGPVTPGAKQSVIMAFDGLNSKGIVTDGTIKRLISGAELSGLTTLALGSARGGSGQLAGPLLISGISVGAGTITDAEMVSMLGVQP